MNYTEVLNRKLKKAGWECIRSHSADRLETLKGTIGELSREAEQTGTFLPFSEAADRLELTLPQQMLLCALWGLESAEGKGLEPAEFTHLYREIRGTESFGMEELPLWVYEMNGSFRLSPVLTRWLESRLPVLPEGLELLLPKTELSYGLEAVLADSEKIFHAAENSLEPSILCIAGEAGSGRQFCMEQICASQNLSLLLADADVFRGNERELNACVLCAGLYEAFFCVRLGKEVREQLLKKVGDCFSFYGIIREEKRGLEEHPEAEVFTRHLAKPDRSLKLRMAEETLGIWAGQLPEDVSLNQLTGRQLPTGQYLRWLKNIRAELRTGSFSIKSVTADGVSSRLNLLPANRTFEELKLPKAQYDQLRQISRMVAARETVMEQWGFGEKFAYGNGISILFYGAPGTGKTMAAQVMAHELGMPLYRVDLSQLISKYIGETQKNIGQVFDEADKSDCILLFDEADAIFTRRSDVSDAQDRYSNAETAYLLQRIEQYAGVSILATNLLQNFDDAFRRRISHMVHFPMPDEGLRKELWDTIFPSRTPVASEVDSLLLAQAFELSGAAIKNAALHGALLAQAEGSEVRMSHILSGIRNEYGKQGKSFSSSQRELLEAFR